MILTLIIQVEFFFAKKVVSTIIILIIIQEEKISAIKVKQRNWQDQFVSKFAGRIDTKRKLKNQSNILTEAHARRFYVKKESEAWNVMKKETLAQVFSYKFF